MHGEPGAATAGSDVFSAGLVLYELFVGERPFRDPTEVFDQGAKFSTKPSEQRSEVPAGFDEWVQELCTFDPDKRPTAAWAVAELAAILHPSEASQASVDVREPETQPEPQPELSAIDYNKLEPGSSLTHKYLIEKPLGSLALLGSFTRSSIRSATSRAR